MSQQKCNHEASELFYGRYELRLVRGAEGTGRGDWGGLYSHSVYEFGGRGGARHCH